MQLRSAIGALVLAGATAFGVRGALAFDEAK
jgi:hypothetical protein